MSKIDDILTAYAGDIDAMKADLAELSKYTKLQDVYHLDLRPEIEETYSVSDKRAYVRRVVDAVNVLDEKYEALEKERKLFLKLLKKAKDPGTRNYAEKVKTSLNSHIGFDLTETYTTTGFLTWLGEIDGVIFDPENFFAERIEEIEIVIKELKKDNNELDDATSRLDVDLSRRTGRIDPRIEDIFSDWISGSRPNYDLRLPKMPNMPNSSRSGGTFGGGLLGGSSWGGAGGGLSVFRGAAGGFSGKSGGW